MEIGGYVEIWWQVNIQTVTPQRGAEMKDHCTVCKD